MVQQLLNVALRTHIIHVGDTRLPLPAQFLPEKSSTPIDLTGLSVEFYMVDSDDAIVVAQSTTGVTVTDASNGKVEKAFLAADVDTAGDFYGYFVLIGSGAEETIPPDSKRLLIQIQDD